MAQPMVSARIASYCPIAPLKNAILLMLIPVTGIQKFEKKNNSFVFVDNGENWYNKSTR